MRVEKEEEKHLTLNLIALQLNILELNPLNFIIKINSFDYIPLQFKPDIKGTFLLCLMSL